MKTNLKYLFLFISFGLSQIGITQDLPYSTLLKIDSINIQIKNAKNEKEKTNSICQLGKIYQNHNQLESSIKTYKSALAFIDAESSPNRYAEVNLIIGEQYLDTKVFKVDSALVNIQNAYSKFNLLEQQLQIRSLEDMTWVHYALYRFEEAMQFCFEGIELAKKADSKNSLRYFYSNMAAFYDVYLKDPEQVIKYSKLALEIIIESGDKSQLAFGYLDHGIDLTSANQFQAALLAFDSCEKYINPELEQSLLLNMNQRKATVYYSLDKLSIAEEYYYKAWEIAKSNNIWTKKMQLPMELADIYLIKGEYDKAIKLSKHALSIVPEKLTLYESEKGNYQLYEAYKAKNNTEKALHYFETWNVLQDSMDQINNLSSIAGLEKKYKDKEQKQQIEFQQTEIKKQKKQKQLLGSLLGILSVLMIGLIILLLKIRNSRKRIKLQHQTIAIQAEELKQLDKVKSRFFANVSHELRTPLTLILGPINSVLKSNNLEPQHLAFLNMAKKNGKDLLQLTKSILDLSKMDSGNLSLVENPVSLFTLTRKIVRSFEVLSTQKRIRIGFNFKADKNLQLLLDKNKTETILNNLISNAIKFTPSEGKVDIKLEDHNDSILIAVSDTGRGITPEELPYIFDRYFQTKNPNAVAEGGLGIGLSLSKKLALLMDGTIWAESIEGEGSTFYLKIPKKEVKEIAKEETVAEEILYLDLKEETVRTVIPKKSKPSIPIEPSTSTALTEEEKTWIKKVELLLKKHLSNPQYSILQLAEDMNMSERQIRRRIKKTRGLSPVQFLKERRLLQAKLNLEEKKYKTLTQVAMSVGFQDPGGFSRNFFKRFGIKPSSYLKNESLKD